MCFTIQLAMRTRIPIYMILFSVQLTGTMEHVRHHGERTDPLGSKVGSISGSQVSMRSLNNAASMLIVDERVN